MRANFGSLTAFWFGTFVMHFVQMKCLKAPTHARTWLHLWWQFFIGMHVHNSKL